ncbi:uncharacterized protein JCM10292_001125 [Rhodotorula paludigena]|uniref:uncharacterized protein n=1 Tax=Rhodotorula paludigena TaxID=86838 RepID=UPI00317D1E03
MATKLYPPLKPYKSELLPVSDLHKISVKQLGNAEGQPVLFVHGGPGGGCDARDAQRFDPAQYRAILVDQRGSGDSVPHTELTDNTTWHLVDDFEKVREHLGIEKWHVFGGSWGSTLSLAHAQKHPERVRSLILRGIFTALPPQPPDGSWHRNGRSFCISSIDELQHVLFTLTDLAPAEQYVLSKVDLTHGVRKEDVGVYLCPVMENMTAIYRLPAGFIALLPYGENAYAVADRTPSWPQLVRAVMFYIAS